ncbi:putative E3 ubiquitin ligase SUD1 [Vitis vinifera]|uniref:RING-type E3 ubiquitin transferase n=1 Tax=Vitis vinifera TaxID=29760 RepID=A0A438KIR9_VITVI|nr:putative E3 ubiquitin ligase SUD1 [Vitis vinifera]
MEIAGPPLASDSEDRNEEDEDVCRICRNSGDSDNPLYYPCACRGSIKFVHEDCLLQWLDRSKTRRCEVQPSITLHHLEEEVHSMEHCAFHFIL